MRRFFLFPTILLMVFLFFALPACDDNDDNDNDSGASPDSDDDDDDPATGPGACFWACEDDGFRDRECGGVVDTSAACFDLAVEECEGGGTGTVIDWHFAAGCESCVDSDCTPDWWSEYI